MKDLLEIHILQNFAPSNLNRDDTGAPKDAYFGGARRARISSQALKRAMRTYVREKELLPPENVGERSRHFNLELGRRLEAAGKDGETAQKVIEMVLNLLKFEIKHNEKDGKTRTEYLIFLGKSELDSIASLLLENWDDLSEASSKKKKSDQQKAVSKDVLKAFDASIRERGEGGDAVDVALFGRMLADRPDKNQDAACQVAHAISTHKIAKEFDYYAAVDELLGPEETGAGMLGTTEFNSACFYRYLTIDLSLLKRNLGEDAELLAKGLKAFAEAAIRAIPTGKQNSFAAHNPPSFIAVRHRRDACPANLANAFEKPIWSAKQSLSEASLKALEEKWQVLDEFYGDSGETVYWSDNGDFSQGSRSKNIGEMLDTVSGWVKAN